MMDYLPSLGEVVRLAALCFASILGWQASKIITWMRDRRRWNAERAERDPGAIIGIRSTWGEDEALYLAAEDVTAWLRQAAYIDPDSRRGRELLSTADRFTGVWVDAHWRFLNGEG